MPAIRQNVQIIPESPDVSQERQYYRLINQTVKHDGSHMAATTRRRQTDRQTSQ